MADHSPGFLKLVESALKNVREISIQEVRTKIKRGDRFHFIDIREDHERQKGYIEGSIHIGRGILERDIETKIPNKDDEIVLYCGGGYRSALSAENLKKMGYTQVYSMAGGYRGWN